MISLCTFNATLHGLHNSFHCFLIMFLP